MSNIKEILIEPLFPEETDKEHPSIKQNRERMKSGTDIPDKLPTAGLYPYPIDEHDFIGEFESKKNLYLTLAHAYNKLVERVEKLEEGLGK